MDSIVTWEFPPEEKRAVIDILAPKKTSAPKIRGISLNWVALTCILVGGSVLYLAGVESELTGPAGIVILFGVIWFPLRLVGMISASSERNKMLRSPGMVTIRMDGVRYFGLKQDWKTGTALITDLLQHVCLEESEGRPWLVFTISYRSYRGSSEFQRKTTKLEVPIPIAHKQDADWVIEKLLQSIDSESAP